MALAPSNPVAEMLSSTIACARSRLLVAPSPAGAASLSGGPAMGGASAMRGARAVAGAPSRFEPRARVAERAPGGGGFRSCAGLHRRRWHARLCSALAHEKLVLHFQPIVSLTAGGISHYEALVRLADRDGAAPLAPACFLPAAERYGLIGELDRVVLEQALARLAAHPVEAVPRLAVNLSAISVTDPGMLSHLSQRLTARGVDATRVVLEITETAAISDVRRAREFCAGAQALGCTIALDDFGVGYGSLSHVKRLPFDYLKIDGDFIRDVRRSISDQLVVKALVGVAHGLGARTIAEFVGDRQTIDLLRSFGVDYAQGFAIGRPQPDLPAVG